MGLEVATSPGRRVRNGLLGKTRATFEEAKVLLEIGAPLRLLSSASTEGGMLDMSVKMTKLVKKAKKAIIQ